MHNTAISGSLLVHFSDNYITIENVHSDETIELPLEAAYNLMELIETKIEKRVTFLVIGGA